jgi:hypothetical protein
MPNVADQGVTQACWLCMYAIPAQQIANQLRYCQPVDAARGQRRTQLVDYGPIYSMHHEEAVEIVRAEERFRASIMLFAQHRKLDIFVSYRDEGKFGEHRGIILKQLAELPSGWVEIVLVFRFNDDAWSEGDAAREGDLSVFRVHRDQVYIGEPVGNWYRYTFSNETPVAGL